jgi:cytochrome P450
MITQVVEREIDGWVVGATLAMAEQRVVLEVIARRVDLEAVDHAPEAPWMRSVTMIPRHGCRVRVLALS